MVTTSCSSDPAVNTGSSTASVKGKKRDKKILALDPASGEAALYDRFAFDPKTLQRDDKGNFVGAVRSEYDGQKNVAFGGGVGKSSYKTKGYASPTWTGNKPANTSTFTGITDGSRFQVPSRFQGTSASQMAQRSRFEGTAAQTSNYRTGKAPEQNAKRLDKPSDAWTDFRRKVYPQPPVMSKADYDKLTVDQTRSILGRED
jgi:hypothetical protein